MRAMDEKQRLKITDRARAAYLGLAIGDALGATVEFMRPREIASQYGVHNEMIGGGWLRLRAGQVTDDTTMSLALGDSILAHPEWSLTAVADHFLAWMKACPVDCGHTCRRGIRRYMLEGSLVAPFSDGDAGNGALMRNLPVVLATLGDEAALARQSLDQARLTHNHPLSDLATQRIAALCAALILGASLGKARQISLALVEREPKFAFERPPRRATGYVVDTVQTVLHHFHQTPDFETCVTDVINCGDDADTTGAIAGMLAGARGGMGTLPKRWLAQLDPRIRARIDDQVPRLLARSALFKTGK